MSLALRRAAVVGRVAEQLRLRSRHLTPLRALALFVLCAALLSLPVNSAAAQEEGGGSSAEYDRILKDALEEFGRGNWVEARTLFERAHQMQPSARTLRAIGLASFEEKRYVAALTALREALQMPVKPLTAKQRREVEDAIRRAEPFVVQYTLELTPEGAQVQVDGAAGVVIDGKLQLDPGGHELVISAEGYEAVQRRMVAESRADATLRVRLQPAGAGGAEGETTVVPGPSGATNTPPAEGGLSTIQYVGIGVGAAGVLSLGASLYFAISAKSKYDDSGCADGGCRDEAAKELNDDALVAGDIATVTAIVGLVAAAAGTTLLIWNPSSEAPGESARLQVTPLVSPTRVGGVVGGRF